MRRDAALVLGVAVLFGVAVADDKVEWFCPPISTVDDDTALCDEPRCVTDGDCISEYENKTDIEMACCYNGCVHTCVYKLEPPIAFDWLEEFRQNEEGILDESPSIEEPMALRQLVRSMPETKAMLPGGCVLTPQQYEELEGFRKHSHVEKCFCDKGGVSCEVSRKNISLTDPA